MENKNSSVQEYGNTEIIKEFLNHKSGPRTKVYYGRVLQAFFAWANQRGKDCLSEDEVQRILACAEQNPEIEAIIRLMVASGIKLSEVEKCLDVRASKSGCIDVRLT